MADQVRIVDDVLQGFFDNLEGQGILGCIDLIVLADHGMAPSPPGEQFFIMNDYVPNILNDARIYDGVFPTIRPKLDTEGNEKTQILLHRLYTLNISILLNVSVHEFRSI